MNRAKLLDSTGELALRCIACRSPVHFHDSNWRCKHCGANYPMENGVHRFLPNSITQDEQEVQNCYSFLWGKISTMENSHARIPYRQATYRLWFGLETEEDWRRLFEDKVVLDAGAGCGMAEHLFIDYPESIYGVDLSRGIDVAARYWSDRPNFIPIQASLFHLPFADEFFDLIFAVGVLHHTPDTMSALDACIRKLKPGGQILFYVYRKKSEVREFADDYIRELLVGRSPEEAWQTLKPLTRLGQALSEIHEKVHIPMDIPELSLKAGRYSVYELVHWHLIACFWSRGYTLAENLRVNLDWYYPRFCHRHSSEAVWVELRDLGMKVERFRVTDSGIAVIARKQASKSHEK